MTRFKHAAMALAATGAIVFGVPAFAQHGGGGEAVDTSALADLPDGQWLSENPYRGSKKAMDVGESAYDANCARCHGIDMISGGIAPDLRELGPQYDEYFINHVRNGVKRAGMTKMPAFEGVLDQKTMWAIRAYVDKRHYEYNDKDLESLYEQSDENGSSDEDEAETEDSAAADSTGEPSTDADGRDADTARATPAADTDRPDGLQRIRNNGTIEVAVYRDFPPWSYSPENAGVSGIDVDIGRALAERLGVGFSLRSFTADETMGDDIRNQVWKGHYLGGGTADAMLHVGMADAFQNANDQATFIAPYYNETMGFAYDASRLGGDIDGALALKGQRIGVEIDSLGDYFLTSAFQGQLREDVVHFDSVPEAMTALNEGEVSAVMAPVGELAGAAAMLDEQNVTTRTVKLTGMYQTDWDVGVAIKAGNPDLAQAIRTEMAEMRSDGTIEAIFKQYDVPYRAPHDDGGAAGAEESATTS